jgi:phosphoserine phosphatase
VRPVPIRAVLFDLDNTLIFEDQSTFASIKQACASAQPRTGIDPALLADAVAQIADTLWRASPEFVYGEAFGIWWGEVLWGDFTGDGDVVRAIRAFAPAFRSAVWEGALARRGVADAALAQELERAYIRVRRSAETIDPDAEAVLAAVSRRRRLALVTNGAGDVQREKLSRTPFKRYFSEVVISVEVGVGKPDPRIFEIALERLRVGAHHAVMVGDSLARDVAGAKAAGILAVWLDRKLWPAEQTRPDATIAALSDLPAALDALEREHASPPGSP